MMIYDTLNWYDHGGYTEMTAPSSNVNVTNEGESKRNIVKINIVELFYKREQIKTQYRQQNFSAELFRGRERIMFYEGRRIRMRE